MCFNCQFGRMMHSPSQYRSDNTPSVLSKNENQDVKIVSGFTRKPCASYGCTNFGTSECNGYCTSCDSARVRPENPLLSTSASVLSSRLPLKCTALACDMFGR